MGNDKESFHHDNGSLVHRGAGHCNERRQQHGIQELHLRRRRTEIRRLQRRYADLLHLPEQQWRRGTVGIGTGLGRRHIRHRLLHIPRQSQSGCCECCQHPPQFITICEGFPI